MFHGTGRGILNDLGKPLMQVLRVTDNTFSSMLCSLFLQFTPITHGDRMSAGRTHWPQLIIFYFSNSPPASHLKQYVEYPEIFLLT